METARPPSSNIGGLMRTVTKIIQFRRTTRGSGNGVVPDDESIQKGVKFQDYFDGSTMPSQDNEEDEKKQLQQKQLGERAAMESFLAKLFASLSAIKASYAQLQIAQEPYDPNTIQSADLELVSELKHLSELKATYQKKEHNPCHDYSSQATQLQAELQEQQNLLKTFQITATKLESELQAKDSELLLLKDQLLDSEKQGRLLEAKLFPRRSLSALDDLHPSGLNSTHFLTVLRYTVKSVRSFVKLMVQQMELSKWDLDRAATSIAPELAHGKPEHRVFAFESYVCRKMFSDFQHPNFRLPDLNECASWDRGRFFDEFMDSKFVKPKQLLDGSSLFLKFCRGKYLSLVHPKMEASLFGSDGSGLGFSNTPLFEGFTEMSRRVWLLHCLFFSFERVKAEASIFQARRGCRFSEVYMDSVVEDDGDATEGQATVGFTVVPGFKVGKTVIQCRVYLARRNGR